MEAAGSLVGGWGCGGVLEAWPGGGGGLLQELDWGAGGRESSNQFSGSEPDIFFLKNVK